MSGLEVLGAVAAALQIGQAIVGSTFATVNYFAKLKNASRDILMASNDLENLQKTFEDIERALRSVSPDVFELPQRHAVEENIIIVKDLCQKLQVKLGSLQYDSSDSTLRKARKAISSIRRSGDLSAISTRMRAAETSLSVLLSAHAIAVVGKSNEHSSREHRLIEQRLHDSAIQSAHQHQVIKSGFTETLDQGKETHQLVDSRYQDLSEHIIEQKRLLEKTIDSSEQAIIAKLDLVHHSVAAVSALPETTLENLCRPGISVNPRESLTNPDVRQLAIAMQQMNEAVYALASKPRALADVYDSVTSPLPTHVPKLTADSHPLLQCMCRRSGKTAQSRWYLGPLSVSTESRLAHLSSCPLISKVQSVKRFQVRLPLAMVLSAALELTFEAKFGAGGNSFSSAIRYYGTVQRSRSPGFVLIDRVREGLLPRDLLEVFQELSRIVAREPQLAILKDADGRTLLLDATWLLERVGTNERYPERHVDPQTLNAAFSGLVNTLIEYGVDKDAKASMTLDIMRGAVNTTATDAAIEFQLGPYHNLFQPTVHLVRADCYVPVTCERRWRNYGWNDLEAIKLIVRENTDLEEAIGLGPLEIAVLQRSKVQTKRSPACHAPPNGKTLHHVFCTEKASYRLPWLSAEDAATMPSLFTGWRTAPSTPQECAIGWHAGVDMLLEAGANGFFALRRAIALSDLGCLELLLRSKCPLFDVPDRRQYEQYRKQCNWGCPMLLCTSWPCYEHDCVEGRFDGFWSSEDPDLVRYVVDALRERRVELGRLTELHLSIEEQHKLGRLSENLMDISAFPVYQALMSKDVPVPTYVWPGTQKTIYHMPSLSHVYMEALYQAGFDSLNGVELNRIHNTGGSDRWDISGLKRFIWLASRGVSTISLKRSWSYLHQIANYVDAKAIELVESLLVSSKLSTHGLTPDTCVCHCSTNGCLPIKVFVGRCDADGLGIRLYLPRHDALKKWFDAFHPNPTSARAWYREMCRLEVFHRLDMAHTCCMTRRTRGSLSEGERTELRSEDVDKAEQLKLVMEAYDQHLKAHSGSFEAFWECFWDRIDSFLPESVHTVSIWERKNWRFDRGYDYWHHYPRRQQQSLQPVPAKYENMDMIEIIKLELFDKTPTGKREP